jgi:hypothetical protein
LRDVSPWRVTCTDLDGTVPMRSLGRVIMRMERAASFTPEIAALPGIVVHGLDFMILFADVGNSSSSPSAPTVLASTSWRRT